MSGKFHKERYINVHNIPSDTPSNTKKLRSSCTKLKAQSKQKTVSLLLQRMTMAVQLMNEVKLLLLYKFLPSATVVGEKVMFSQACVNNSVQVVGVGCVAKG